MGEARGKSSVFERMLESQARDASRSPRPHHTSSATVPVQNASSLAAVEADVCQLSELFADFDIAPSELTTVPKNTSDHITRKNA